MDKSPAYVTMCEKAAEVQEHWRQEHGDVFLGEQGRITCWVAGVHDTKPIRQGMCIERSSDDKLIRLRKYIWLPRLDQLIELAQVPGKRYERITQDFFEWTKREYPFSSGEPRHIFGSLEQIWLAFVMQRKFDKGWDGLRWKRVRT